MAPRIFAYFLPALKAFRTLFPVLLACNLLLGCAGGQSPVGRLAGLLPPGSDAADAPEIFVIRSDFSDYLYMMLNAPSHKIVVDDNEVFMIAPWGYTNFHITPGEHHIGIKCFGGWSESWKEDSLTMQFEANRRYYFNTRQSLKCASIRHINETEGLALIKESRHTPFEYNNPPGSDPGFNYPRTPRWDPIYGL